MRMVRCIKHFSLISYLLRVSHRELDALINLKTLLENFIWNTITITQILLAVCMYRIAGNFRGDKIFVVEQYLVILWILFFRGCCLHCR